MAIHQCTAHAGWQGLADLLGKAAAGDEIHLEAGTYHGKCTLSLSTGVRLIGAEGVTLRQDGEGPILTITGSDCQLSKIAFFSTKQGQICVRIENAERVGLSECTFDGGREAQAAVVAICSRAIDILSCSAKEFAPQQGEFFGAISLGYSEGHITKTQCYDNLGTGILFSASIGLAEQNDCWGNQFGIWVACAGDIPDHLSNVTVRNNRFHENGEIGIVFSGSTGQAEQNTCWENTNGGILIQCPLDTPDHPSYVTVRNNRCHENSGAGIAFTRSTGTAEQNDCWGNRGNSGILVQRLPKYPQYPSTVTVRGNRCHENSGAGIVFTASDGLAEKNDCWKNIGRGILVQCDPDAPQYQSIVNLQSNRCRENSTDGISLIASVGLAEQNDCQGNTFLGIIVQCLLTVPQYQSDVTLQGNRCWQNGRAGIGFLASTGQAEQNECWGNGDNHHNEIIREDSPTVAIHDHREFLSQSPEELRRARLLLHPLGTWFTNPLVINHPRAESLADYLHSGGCPDCFSHFWTGSTQATPTPPPTETAPAVPDDDRIRTYEVRPSQNQTVTIHRTTVPPGRATPPKNGLEGLTSLVSRFSQLAKTRTSNDVPLRWAVGFISAEPTTETTFTDWLTAAKSHDPTIEGRSIDCTRYGLDSAADLSSKLEQALVAPYRTWWQRLGAQVEALFFMPAREVLIAGITMLILTISSVIVLARTFDIDMPLWPLPENCSTLTKSLIHLSTNILDQWQNHLSTMGMIAGAWILVPLFLWNRNLPWSLHFPLTFLMAAFKAVAEIGPIKEVLQATPLKRLGEFVQSHACSQTSRRLWLRRHLYGYRLFDRIRPGALPPQLIALLHVDVPSPADLEDMRLLLEICPENQPVVVITQMSGLSMLTSAYLDVWFPQNAAGSRCPPTAYLLHDLDAGMIQPLPDLRPIPTPNNPAPILKDFDQLLGWSDPEHSPDQRHETRTKYGNTLILPTWSFQEFLLALVIGSTPYTHMMVQGPYTASSHQYRTDFLDALTPYLTVLELDRESAQLDLTASEPCIERGKALLPVKVDEKAQLWWVGRGGYRRALADLVRRWYAYCAKSKPSTVQTPDASEPYLAHLLICGELYNLICLTVLIDTPPSSSDHARNHQLLPLHMEAAYSLVEERLALSLEPAEPSVLVEQWQSVITQVLRRDSGPILTELERARLCAMYLKATALYRHQGRNELGRQEEEELNTVIAQPFHKTEGTTLWAAFCRDVATLLQQLAYRETATASALLEAKLTQEWHAFPSALKESLRNQCANFSRDWIEDIDRQNSPEMLLERAQRLREQPALVIGTLSRLAVASLGTSSSESDRTSLLIRIADAVLRLRRAAGDDAPSIQLEPWKQFPSAEAISAATALLCDEALVQRLCTILEAGAQSRDKLRRAVEHVVCPIEGIALGVHGHLHKVLEEAKETDNIEVLGSAGTPNQHQVVV